MSTKAAALKYEHDTDSAPRILARGIGAVGDYIVTLANKSNIPVYRNEKLAESLVRLKDNDEIPMELYTIVAEIFAFVYSLKSSIAS